MLACAKNSENIMACGGVLIYSNTPSRILHAKNKNIFLIYPLSPSPAENLLNKTCGNGLVMMSATMS